MVQRKMGKNLVSVTLKHFINLICNLFSPFSLVVTVFMKLLWKIKKHKHQYRNARYHWSNSENLLNYKIQSQERKHQQQVK